MLKKKHYSSNSDWIRTFENIRNIVSRKEIEVAADQAIAAIRQRTCGKRAAYAWSGGKDSIVLSDLCRKAGIRMGMIALTHLEYPEFHRWIQVNLPDDVKVVQVPIDMAWLIEHPQKLFPIMSMSTWQNEVHIRPQNYFYEQGHFDILILGRRKSDGNYVGKGGCYTDRQGRTKYSPLADWPHEWILAYIAYHNLPLPPIYKWKDGFVQGTHPWYCRTNKNGLANTWREVYEIDPGIVMDAAPRIESAKRFLEGLSCRS